MNKKNASSDNDIYIYIYISKNSKENMGDNEARMQRFDNPSFISSQPKYAIQTNPHPQSIMDYKELIQYYEKKKKRKMILIGKIQMLKIC